MKIRLLPALTVLYFVLIFIFLKEFSIFSAVFLIIALLIDYFTNAKAGIKNLLYLLSAFAAFVPLFKIFIIYLPFIVFGALLQKRSFVKDYLVGFAVSFVPSTAIYLISTYMQLRLALPSIIFIFYLLPVIAILALKKRSFKVLEVDAKECVFILIVLFFTALVAWNIVDDKNLFIANGGREFYRVQLAFNGLANDGVIPVYDPGIGTGEATYLWTPPTPVTHFALANLLLKFNSPLLFFNAHSFFILLLVVMSIGILFFSINKNGSALDMLAVSIVTVITGLNFVMLQSIESVRAFYGFPIANLLLSLILSNPKHFKDFVMIMYLSALMLLIHSSFGVAVVLLAASLFLLTKIHYFKDRGELKELLHWTSKNKLKLLAALIVIPLLVLFYVSTPFVFKDLLVEDQSAKLNYNNIKSGAVTFFKDYFTNEFLYLSLRYPDVNRIDDHKFGFFLSVFGTISFFLLIAMYRVKAIKNYRIFAFGYILHLIGLSLINFLAAVRLGGFFRTPGLYLLILLGASLTALIFLFNNKYIKSVFIGIVFIAFIHSMPYASQNVNNIHKEQFMSGEIYKKELGFIKQLPAGGRIMTYGLFNNVIDYGISYFTGRYGSRSENFALQIVRTPYEKIHGANSFGDPSLVTTKSGAELYNYLRIGGYRYLFVNAAHPVGAYVVSQIYPNFSSALYQNGPMVFLALNNVSYAEKVELARNVDKDAYREKNGYRYITISPYYNFKYGGAGFKEAPKEPEPLEFERISPTKVKISGNFNNDEWVVFKEQYFSRWKAYMNNREVPVFTDNNEMILIKTIKGDNILLEYSVLNQEKITGILSLIGFLGFSVLIVFLLRRD